jgi:hypothetical protein
MYSNLKCSLTSPIVVSLLLISGCSGEGTVPVKLNVVFPGEESFGPEDSLVVDFQPVDKTLKPGSARLKGTENSCQVMTGNVKGLAPGEYVVTFNMSGNPGAGMEALQARRESFQSRYKDINSGTLRFTVTNNSGQAVTLDLKEEKLSTGK